MRAGWSTSSLGEIFEISRGGSPRPIENFITDQHDGLNWIKIGDASASGKFIEKTKEKIKHEGLSKTRFVVPGDFLLTNSMSFGRPYIMATSGCIHDGWLVLKPISKNKAHPDFFYYLLGSASLYAKFAARAGGSTVKNLNSEIVASVEVSLPPLNEQRWIASILDRADALRRKRKHTLELLNGLRQSIFLDMFGNPISNLDGLPVTPLHSVISSARPITYGILMPGPNIPDGVPYVRVVDIQNGLISVKGLKRTTEAISRNYSRSTLRAGDLLISIRGHVGRMAIAPSECDGANITQDTARLAVEGADAEFIKAQLETDAAQSWMARRTKGAAVKGLNLGDLKLFPLLLPPIKEQLEFARRIGGLTRKANAARQQSQELDALFASLQHRAFTGQL